MNRAPGAGSSDYHNEVVPHYNEVWYNDVLFIMKSITYLGS